MKLKVIDLCCGAGLFSCGFQTAGFEIILGVDIDSIAISSYQENFPSSVVWESDIRELSSIPKCDVLIGSPPCQKFSKANRNPDGKKGMDLVDQFVNLARNSGVKYWIMEEVPPVLDFIDHIECRKEIWECSDFGSKNLRPRLFAGEFPDPVQLYPPFKEPSPTVMASETSMKITDMRYLQGIPSWMKFHGTDADKRRQIGNGVPIEIGEALGLGIIYDIENKRITGHQEWHKTTVGYRRVRTEPRIYKSVPGWVYCEECETMIPWPSNNGIPRSRTLGVQSLGKEGVQPLDME